MFSFSKTLVVLTLALAACTEASVLRGTKELKEHGGPSESSIRSAVSYSADKRDLWCSWSAAEINSGLQRDGNDKMTSAAIARVKAYACALKNGQTGSGTPCTMRSMTEMLLPDKWGGKSSSCEDGEKCKESMCMTP